MIRPIRSLVLGVAAGVALLGAPDAHADGPPTTTPIEHFVTLMQANHSFDNYFGTYPGADGIPDDACMPIDPQELGRGCVEPERIGGRPAPDLRQSADVGRAQLHGGRMDGFISAQGTPALPQRLVMGRYDDRDIPYYWNVADEYVLFDRFFTSALGGSVPNHMYWVTGGPGNRHGDFIPPGGFDDPTIFDRLQEKGISWKFYIQNYDPTVSFRSRDLGYRGTQVVSVPLLAYPRYLDDPELFKHLVPIEEYFDDLRKGTLPAVSYVVPSGSSEHPPGSVRAGETFVRSLINALMRSSAWSSSAFTWTYDDWGGWYDHVKPPAVDRFGLGFRAPALLVSPYAKRGHIEHATMDFTSIVRFIEDNWGLKSLTARDRGANSLARALDFEQRPRPAIFLSRNRHVAAPVEPKRAAIFVGYGAAAALVLLLLVLAGISDRLRDRRRPPAPRADGFPSKARESSDT